jgi:sugar transferase (PEP-CTERM system associated)
LSYFGVSAICRSSIGGFFNQKIILLGSSELGDKIEKEILGRKDSGYVVAVKVLEENCIGGDADRGDTACITKKRYDGLCELAKEHGIGKIVVAITEKRGGFPTEELLRCRVAGIDIIEGISFYETLTGKFAVEQINPAWLIFQEGFRQSPGRRFVKRAVDLFLSSVLLIIISPVLIAVAILIKFDSGGPVVYSQDRVGRNKKTYRVHKFRSMVVDAEKETGAVWASDDDGRVTRVGRWIRRLRIDELPQIWNVLEGNMSFVGPRPEREFFVRRLEAEIPYYSERFSVKPGITGWAQISYGYGGSVKDALEKLNYDLFYVKNMSTFMDLMITLRTVKTVLFATGAR